MLNNMEDLIFNTEDFSPSINQYFCLKHWNVLTFSVGKLKPLWCDEIIKKKKKEYIHLSIDIIYFKNPKKIHLLSFYVAPVKTPANIYNVCCK